MSRRHKYKRQMRETEGFSIKELRDMNPDSFRKALSRYAGFICGDRDMGAGTVFFTVNDIWRRTFGLCFDFDENDELIVYNHSSIYDELVFGSEEIKVKILMKMAETVLQFVFEIYGIENKSGDIFETLKKSYDNIDNEDDLIRLSMLYGYIILFNKICEGLLSDNPVDSLSLIRESFISLTQFKPYGCIDTLDDMVELLSVYNVRFDSSGNPTRTYSFGELNSGSKTEASSYIENTFSVFDYRTVINLWDKVISILEKTFCCEIRYDEGEILCNFKNGDIYRDDMHEFFRERINDNMTITPGSENVDVWCLINWVHMIGELVSQLYEESDVKSFHKLGEIVCELGLGMTFNALIDSLSEGYIFIKEIRRYKFDKAGFVLDYEPESILASDDSCQKVISEISVFG